MPVLTGSLEILLRINKYINGNSGKTRGNKKVVVSAKSIAKARFGPYLFYKGEGRGRKDRVDSGIFI